LKTRNNIKIYEKLKMTSFHINILCIIKKEIKIVTNLVKKRIINKMSIFLIISIITIIERIV